MAERTDVTVDWGLSPRLIEVALPSTEISAQDLHDTLKSNTKQAGEADDSLENMDDEPIIDSAGKENLGGGVEVGITSTLQDGQVAFGRTSPRSTTTDTITTAGTNSVIATGATWVTDGVERGDWVLNWTDFSVSEVLEVISNTELRVRTPSGLAASSNDYAVNDVVTVWEVDVAELEGGNVVAIDDVAAELFPLFTTFGRFATLARASSATTQNQDALNFSTFQGGVWIDQTNSTGLATSGTTFPIGTPQAPVLTLADAKTIAVANGFRKLFFLGDYTFSSGDNVDGYTLVGEGQNLSILDLGSNTSTVSTRIQQCELQGNVNGALDVLFCHVRGVTGVGSTLKETEFRNCLFEPGTAIQLEGTGTLQTIHLVDCDSGSPGDTPVDLDYNGATASLTVRKYAGGMRFLNNTVSGTEISYDGDSHMTLDASNTEGTWAVRGDVKITNNASGNPNVTVRDQGTFQKLLELWQRLGLDPDNPLTTNDDNSISVGSITITAVNTATSTTQTRA